MPEQHTKSAVNPMTLELARGSSYPGGYDQAVAGRCKYALGDYFGLTHYGVNLVELPPGCWSAQRHWHSREDEFIFVVSGELCLVTNRGEQVLSAGMVAGFPAALEDGHHLVNRTDNNAVYLEVGDRNAADECHYPDIDLFLAATPDGHRFQHTDGTPYSPKTLT